MTSDLELYPQADPRNPATVAAKRRRLAEAEAELADYYAGHGPETYYRRGFVGDTKAEIRRIKRWLKAAEAAAGLDEAPY
jgi:hypothetical protein